MSSHSSVADMATLEKVATALKNNGMDAFIVDTGEAAKTKVFELLPQGAEVMDMTSRTLDQIGVSEAITKSGKYNAVKPRMYSMDRATQGIEIQKMGSAPEWVVGSAAAITQDGQAVFASATGSQLPAYAYGAAHVIWVVGGQKIVKNLDEAMKRIQEHIFPLENERAKKAYGVPGSVIAKTLVISKEINPGRITVILVKESLGY